MKSLVLLIALSISLAGCDVHVNQKAAPPLRDHSDAEKAEMLSAAKSIIHALDRGDYDAVWDNASDSLKHQSSKAAFHNIVAGLRGVLGQPDSRGDYLFGFTRSIDPSLPDGDYAMVKVETAFNGKTITEKVVLGRESNQWKLVGYFVEAKAKIKLFG